MSVPKNVIINLNINNFSMIDQEPNFCAISFSEINPDKNKCTHILQGGLGEGGGGAIAH